MKLADFANSCQMNTSVKGSLVRAVVRQMGGWKAFQESAPDVLRAGAAAGFGNFIYYQDTVSFTARHRPAILSALSEMAESIGEDRLQTLANFNCLKLSISDTAGGLHNYWDKNRSVVYNALAWFALEEVCRAYEDCAEKAFHF